MIATKADPAVKSITGTHYATPEMVRKYPQSESLRWAGPGEPDGAVLLDRRGRTLAVLIDVIENDGDMDFGPNALE